MNEYLQKIVHPGQPGSKPMSIDSISDLTLKDIKFLISVRDINANPEQYPGTEGGVAAANTTSLRQGTSLSKGEIRHRLDNKSDIADENLGLLTIHDPPQTKQGYGPKSVELTSWGDRFLNAALAVHGVGDHDPADVAQADRISALEARIEELEETIHVHQMETKFVFKNPNNSEQWRAMIRAHDLLFRSLMEAPGTAYDDVDIDEDEVAAKVLARLNQVSREG